MPTRKPERNKDTRPRAIQINPNKPILWVLEVLPTFLYFNSNLIEFLFFPSLRTCFKRRFLARRCYFSFTCAPRFFNHTSITKQTNKFRACAADTNIDVSYEIQRSREKALDPNTQHLYWTRRTTGASLLVHTRI